MGSLVILKEVWSEKHTSEQQGEGADFTTSVNHFRMKQQEEKKKPVGLGRILRGFAWASRQFMKRNQVFV